MKKVNVMERFNTSWGLIFIVENEHFNVGDMFLDQNNETYRVEKILMHTRPTNINEISLVVTKCVGN